MLLQLQPQPTQRLAGGGDVLTEYMSHVGVFGLVLLACASAQGAETINPFAGPCYRAIPMPFATSAPNANAVKTGLVPAQTDDQKLMRSQYLRYQARLHDCLAKDVPLLLSPLTHGLYEQLKTLTAAEPLLNPTQAGVPSLLGSLSQGAILPLATGALGLYYAKADTDYA